MRGPRTVALALAAAAALASGGCFSSSTPPAPPPPPPGPAPAGQPPSADPAAVSRPDPTTADLTSNALRAHVVVLATVVWLGPPPPKKQGEPCSTQGVSYRVEEVYRGNVTEGELRVAQPVCLGRPLVDGIAFSLSRADYAPGKKFVLFLEADTGGSVRYTRYDGDWTSNYKVWDPRTGALPDSDELRAQVRKAVGATGGSGPVSGSEPF